MTEVGKLLGLPVHTYNVQESITFDQYAAEIVKFRPKDILNVVCKELSSELETPSIPLAALTNLHPQSVLSVVRDSLILGNNSLKKKSLSKKDIQELCKTFNSIYYAEISSVLSTLASFSQQKMFFDSERDFHALARSLAILEISRKKLPNGRISDEDVHAIFGKPLITGFAELMVLWEIFSKSAEWKSTPYKNYSKIFEGLGLDFQRVSSLICMMESITANRRAFKVDFESAASTKIELRNVAYNPIFRYPIINFTKNEPPYVPLSRLILMQGSLAMILRTMAEQAKDRGITPQEFFGYYGHVLQQYVGDQLQLIDGAVVVPEIKYGPGRAKATIDWFLELPSVLVLIDAKALTLNAHNRTGDESLELRLIEVFDKVFNQVNETNSLFSDPPPEFAVFNELTLQKRKVGLIVSGEDIPYGNNFASISSGLSITSNLPTAHISLNELELLVCFSVEEVEKALIKLLDDKSNPKFSALTLEHALPKREVTNSILSTQLEILSKALEDYKN